MFPPSDLKRQNSSRFDTIFPDLDHLYAFKNPQLFKLYPDFGKLKRAYKSEVFISAKILWEKAIC